MNSFLNWAHCSIHIFSLRYPRKDSWGVAVPLWLRLDHNMIAFPDRWLQVAKASVRRVLLADCRIYGKCESSQSLLSGLQEIGGQVSTDSRFVHIFPNLANLRTRHEPFLRSLRHAASEIFEISFGTSEEV